MYEYPRCYDYNYYDSSDILSVPEPEPEPPKMPAKKIPKRVFKNYIDEIRYEQWREHRTRLRGAEYVFDKEPPSINPVAYTKTCNLRQEAIKFMERTMTNMQMLKTLSLIRRSIGTKYNRSEKVIGQPSAVGRMVERIDVIERENRDMGKRIRDMTSSIDTGRNKEQHGKKKPRVYKPFKLPKKALAKYANMPMTIPKTNRERYQLFRPRIFFDVQLGGSRPLGRIEMELFTEAAPQVVLQLVQACFSDKFDKFNIKRLFPGLWLDIDFPLDFYSKLHNPLEYDGKVIDHGETNYVVSFSKDYLRGFPNRLNFSISFKPISMANGKRVGFGRVIKGMKILESLQSYGNKHGIITRAIKFTNGGVL